MLANYANKRVESHFHALGSSMMLLNSISICNYFGNSFLMMMLFLPLFAQGTSKTGAQFDIGLLGLKFTYFLKLTHIPNLNTLTWTLDYTKNSDFGKVE